MTRNDSIRILRYTDNVIVAVLDNHETGEFLSGCVGTIQIFNDDNEAITDALDFTDRGNSPVDGEHEAELEGGSPAFDAPAGSNYYAQIIITSPFDRRSIHRVHIVDG